MHMADALVSPAVAGVTATIAVGALCVAASKVKKNDDHSLVPLMGVMGAFVFAAQMINFSIPGTGSSGHIIGGVLLASMLGPWAALITLASVLVVQCLIFADGGLMALGCNILNMGIMTCLVAYPLVYRPLVGRGRKSLWRIMAASVTACVVGLELGACLVTAETELSQVTALPWSSFFLLMTGIHLLIGVGEGVATALVIYYVQEHQPSLLLSCRDDSVQAPARKLNRKVIVVLAGVALVLAATFTWVASSNPDGLEWSIERLTGSTEVAVTSGVTTHQIFAHAQQGTSLLPEYNSSWSGIIGCTVVVVLVWGVSAMLAGLRRQKA